MTQPEHEKDRDFAYLKALCEGAGFEVLQSEPYPEEEEVPETDTTGAAYATLLVEVRNLISQLTAAKGRTDYWFEEYKKKSQYAEDCHVNNGKLTEDKDRLVATNWELRHELERAYLTIGKYEVERDHKRDVPEDNTPYPPSHYMSHESISK